MGLTESQDNTGLDDPATSESRWDSSLCRPFLRSLPLLGASSQGQRSRFASIFGDNGTSESIWKKCLFHQLFNLSKFGNDNVCILGVLFIFLLNSFEFRSKVYFYVTGTKGATFQNFIFYSAQHPSKFVEIRMGKGLVKRGVNGVRSQVNTHLTSSSAINTMLVVKPKLEQCF